MYLRSVLFVLDRQHLTRSFDPLFLYHTAGAPLKNIPSLLLDPDSGTL